MVKLLIVGSSKLPVPATKGGAVPNLIEEIVKENECEEQLDLYCCSVYDDEAMMVSRRYSKTKFVWVRIPDIIEKMDKCFMFILKNILRLQYLQSLGFLFRIAWYTFSVARILKNEEYDKVVFENSVPVLWAIKIFGNKRKYKNKYYIHMHSVPNRYFGNENIFSNCKKLISISKYVEYQICKNPKVQLDVKQKAIMYNCLDTTLFHPSDCGNRTREQYGITPEDKVIIFAGRLCPEKGIEEVLNALININDKKYKLVIVGTNFYKSDIVSPYEKYLHELATAVSEQVIFTGYVDYPNMREVYCMGDVIVLPSMWEEPAGMTILEAMACGKVVITTNSGGIPEYVGLDNCVMLERNDKIVETIANYIVYYCENRVEAQLLGELATKHASLYNQSYYYEQLLEIIN